MTTLLIVNVLLGLAGLTGTTIFFGLWLSSEWKLFKNHGDSSVFVKRSENEQKRNKF